jgi:hypothetical protein
MASSASTAARFLKRPASRRGTHLRVASTGEQFVDCDHRGASDDGDGRHHENSFDHDSLPADFNVRTPEESCSRKTRELRGWLLAASRGFVGWAKRKRAHHFVARPVIDGGHVANAPLPTLQFHYSIANALETMATGVLSVADSSVTRPKLMVRPRRTTRASASTSEAATARMKCVVWSTVVIGR